MKNAAGLLVAIAGLVLTAMLAIQGATLRYVVDIEHRMTRLETLQDARARPTEPPTVPARRAPRRILAEGQT